MTLSFPLSVLLYLPLSYIPPLTLELSPTFFMIKNGSFTVEIAVLSNSKHSTQTEGQTDEQTDRWTDRLAD